MQPDLTTYLEKRQEYLANRTMFPLEELAKYSGQWVAWSPDGTRIVAHATEPTPSTISFVPAARIRNSVSWRGFRPATS